MLNAVFNIFTIIRYIRPFKTIVLIYCAEGRRLETEMQISETIRQEIKNTVPCKYQREDCKKFQIMKVFERFHDCDYIERTQNFLTDLKEEQQIWGRNGLKRDLKSMCLGQETVYDKEITSIKNDELEEEKKNKEEQRTLEEEKEAARLAEKRKKQEKEAARQEQERKKKEAEKRKEEERKKQEEQDRKNKEKADKAAADEAARQEQERKEKEEEKKKKQEDLQISQSVNSSDGAADHVDGNDDKAGLANQNNSQVLDEDMAGRSSSSEQSAKIRSQSVDYHDVSEQLQSNNADEKMKVKSSSDRGSHKDNKKRNSNESSLTVSNSSDEHGESLITPITIIIGVVVVLSFFGSILYIVSTYKNKLKVPQKHTKINTKKINITSK